MNLLRSRFGLITIAILIEFAAIAITYQILVPIECQASNAETGCRALRSVFLRGFSAATILAVFLWLRTDAFRALKDIILVGRQKKIFLWLHFLGVALIFAPAIVFPGHALEMNFNTALLVMSVGAAFSVLGALMSLAPLSSWGNWMKAQSWFLILVIAVGLVTPDLANSILSLWNVEAISRLTFSSVQFLLQLNVPDAMFDGEHYVIGANGFFVQVAAQCSGVEGFALIAVFSALYAVLMGRDLRQKRFWLVLVPLALLMSWLLNVVRIATLILIGINGAPEHAQNGFHSYAGWLLFTLLSLAILVLAQNWSWLHHNQSKPSNDTSLADDWLAARILPFIVFLVSGILATTFWQQPELAYPYKMIAMAIVLWFFRKLILALGWKPDSMSILAGAIVGGFWVYITLTAVDGDAELAIAGLTSVWFAVWVTSRLVGTIVFVPIIEELVFRGYVLHRLNNNTVLGRVLALIVSSSLFGLMHGRWAEGFAAGLVFGLIYLRRNNLTDAIIAHAIANAIVGFAALATGNWAII